MATGDPEDALTESNNETLVAFDVTPDAADRRIPSGFDEWRNRFEARPSEPAFDGRANAELTDAVAELVDAPALLAHGASSPKKTVAVAAPTERVLAELLAAIED